MRKFLAAFLLTTSALLGLLPSLATAAPAHTDVMLVFDTTGSMSGALEEATNEIEEAMVRIRRELPDVEFGLAEVRDYTQVFNPGLYEYDDEESQEGFEPWTLLSPIGASEYVVKSQLSTLYATGGGDGPEAYGRALFETAQNPTVGWRSGARGVIILVADNVPHDNELNEGIAPELWYESPFDTGPDPGSDNVVGTADDLDWQSTVLPTLVIDGKPLEFVDYHGEPGFLPYWQNWAARTGGTALEANGTESLADELAPLVAAGANAALPSCPAGLIREAAEHCVAPPAPAIAPAAPAPAPLPSNSFSVVPRISCTGVCHVVLVQMEFDSAGTVVTESALSDGADSLDQHAQTATASSKKTGGSRPLVERSSQNVKAGKNTLKVKLTPVGIAGLKKHGHLALKLKVTFTPNGGTAKTLLVKVLVKVAAKAKHHH